MSQTVSIQNPDSRPASGHPAGSSCVLVRMATLRRKEVAFALGPFALFVTLKTGTYFEGTFPKKESIGSSVDAMYEQLAFDIHFSISFFLSFLLSLLSRCFNESTMVAVNHQSGHL